MVTLHKVTIAFTPSIDVPFINWHGLILSALVTEALINGGFAIDHNARKHLYITPILNQKDEPILGRVLKGGLEYKFNVTVVNEEARDALVNWFVKKNGFILNGVNASLTSVSITEEKVEISSGGKGNESSKVIVTWNVDYGPTVFRFRASNVLYPSPRMLIFSMARRLSDVLTNNEIVIRRGNVEYVGVIGSINLKDIARELALNTELIKFTGFKLIKLSLGSRGNVERRVPAFTAKASYLTLVDKSTLPIFREMIKVANMTGVGKNTSIALGYVKTRIEGIREIKGSSNQ
ncbi:CRISPR system precrRNA processing endoribonuclease RAMP protein Cas6 [Caldivirga maquilingensis]|uniref:CRISPR-associated protein Cas6 C-terminal domain-containing protein n=1 Tax=Caldivirga maquilingensis (strain ATCC 700844 / DSM 13496 / JCM 10307 / IC-167) TaxID=397948 RepID=A8M9A8_CALMQ|nr:CRISPR system precrRNA processing endoribonuclease RAMP protein Cas6 [Caldivirga maquilingensis]ABW02327.1 hypothetical protein Cmaq_1503 [Caldivirga maquilingensis IC-167]